MVSASETRFRLPEAALRQRLRHVVRNHGLRQCGSAAMRQARAACYDAATSPGGRSRAEAESSGFRLLGGRESLLIKSYTFSYENHDFDASGSEGSSGGLWPGRSSDFLRISESLKTGPSEMTSEMTCRTFGDRLSKNFEVSESGSVGDDLGDDLWNFW